MTDISCIVRHYIVALVLGPSRRVRVSTCRRREEASKEASEATQESSGFKAKILGIMPMTFILGYTVELQDIFLAVADGQPHVCT